MKSRHLSYLLLAFLSACDTTASLVELRHAPPPATPYGEALAERYKTYAEEQLTRYDWWSSKYFADKGLKVTEGLEPPPEDPRQWSISAGELPELLKAREAVLEAVNDTTKTTNPKTAADAVMFYDCWVESMDDGWQNPTIERCRDGLFSALGTLANPSANSSASATVAGEPVVSSSLVLYFPFDSAHLEGPFLQQMQSLIASLRANPKAQLIINGHADRSGDDSYNLSLSAKRAEYITNLLEKNGFSADRITYYAFGETDPAIDTPDNVREKANRRVEIFLE